MRRSQLISGNPQRSSTELGGREACVSGEGGYCRNGQPYGDGGHGGNHRRVVADRVDAADLSQNMLIALFMDNERV